MIDYQRPSTLEEALPLITSQHVIVAGATDIYPVITQQKAWSKATSERWVDISALDELRGVAETSEYWKIGALTTWSELASASLPPAFDGLRAAALQVGGVQIQNRATLGGNLCNASPAADSIPPLLCLDASVELVSAAGIRHLSLEDFIKGNRKTALAPGELLSAILVPRANTSQAGFYKLGARKYLVISIVMASVNLSFTPVESGQPETATIEEIRVAVGACSEVAQRLRSLEKSMVGLTVDEAVIEVKTAGRHLPLKPIDDVRATAEYRRWVAGEIIARALQQSFADQKTSVEAHS